MLRYISHPNVAIDPTVPVPRWGLNAEGRRRARIMADRPWTATIGRLISSDETKAVETAQLLAANRGLTVEVRPQTGETDRRATGYVSAERHHRLAERFFAEPDRSADGWETAADAQRRIVVALSDVLSPDARATAEQTPANTSTGGTDIAVVGHGGVGTLLYCHLAGQAIDGALDQPGQGHYWSFDLTTRLILHHWTPIED